MWGADERDIYEMEVLIEYKSRQRNVRSDALPTPNLAAIALDVLADVTASTVVRTYMRDTLRAYIVAKDIRTKSGKQFLVLLFATSDKRRPDGVVTDPFSASRREDTKHGDEGSDHSCHIVIALDPTLPGGRRYRVAIEHVPHIPFSFVGRYLKAMLLHLSKVKRYTVPHPAGVKVGGQFKPVPVKVNCEFAFMPSDELVRSLEGGTLGGIELSKERPGNRAFDEGDFTTDKKETLVLKLKKNRVEKARITDVLGSVFKRAKQESYKTARVSWKTAGGAHSANFDCETKQPLSKRFVKKETVSLLNRLSASTEKIDDHLSGVMMSWISSQ